MFASLLRKALKDHEVTQNILASSNEDTEVGHKTLASSDAQYVVKHQKNDYKGEPRKLLI